MNKNHYFDKNNIASIFIYKKHLSDVVLNNKKKTETTLF
jgi:hypothetical protein